MCNELCSFRNRLAKETKHNFEIKHPDKLELTLDKIVDFIEPNYTVLELADFLGDKKGKLLRRYTAAARDVLAHGFHPHGTGNPKDMIIKMFLKTEIYAQIDKDPRMISGCSTKFILGFARHASALERALKQVPQVMSGKNLVERGEAFRTLIYPHTVIRKTDYSRFDSSQRVELQWTLMLGVLERLRLRGVITHQLFNTFLCFLEQETYKNGEYPNGLTYTLIGCMASGSILTKVLNTLINLTVMGYTCEVNGIPWDFIVDGDDGLLGYDTTITTHFSEFGLDVTDAEVSDYHDADFCSSKFLMVRPGVFHQVQDFRKTYNNIGVLKSKQIVSHAATYYYSLGYMYNLMYPNCPGFTELSSFLMSLAPLNRRYYSHDVLTELHPQFDTWCPHTQFQPFDYGLVQNEMVLAYGLSHGELKYMLQSLTMQITLTPDMCKRYRVTSAPEDPLMPDQIHLVSRIVESRVETAGPPPLLKQLYHRQGNGWQVYTTPLNLEAL